jgi:hypothetical protein
VKHVRSSDEDVWWATRDNMIEGGGGLQEGQEEVAGRHG